MQNSKFLPAAKIPMLRDALAQLDDDKAIYIQSLELRDPMVVLVVSLFLGEFGLDRFLIGDIMMGIVKLVTGGGCGIWYIIDWFLVMDKAKEYNYKIVCDALALQGVTLY